MRRLAAWVALIAGLAMSAVVLQAGISAQAPVLHEQVPGLAEGATLNLTSTRTDSETDPSEVLFHDGQALVKPSLEDALPEETSLRASSGLFSGQAAPGRDGRRFRPDRITSFGSQSNYYSAFSPSVSPHKRLTALDAVAMDGSVPVLVVAPSPTRVVPITTAVDDGQTERDRFWGRVRLDFSEGNRVPLPSVAPKARILALETSPPASLRIEKDKADNYFAVLEEALEQTLEVTFMTDASVDYFNPFDIPDTPVGALSDQVQPLPRVLQRQAEEFLSELGLQLGVGYRKALETLVKHFRSFEESEDFPAGGQSIFLDLARGKRGVCRHRAYAFVISAMSLGIPARFLMNEAHAWSEVQVPEVGWMRVDLGGAVTNFHDTNPSARVHYTPRHRDPLPRPQPYLEALARARGALAGETGAGSENGAGATGPRRNTVEVAVNSADGARAVETSGRANRVRASRPGSNGEGLASEGEAGRSHESEAVRVPLRLSLLSNHHSVFRGRSLTLEGRAETIPEGPSLEGLRIEVELVSRDRSGHSWPVGVTRTDATGAFTGTFEVPQDLPVGYYRILVQTTGSAEFFPARVR